MEILPIRNTNPNSQRGYRGYFFNNYVNFMLQSYQNFSLYCFNKFAIPSFTTETTEESINWIKNESVICYYCFLINDILNYVDRNIRNNGSVLTAFRKMDYDVITDPDKIFHVLTYRRDIPMIIYENTKYVDFVSKDVYEWQYNSAKHVSCCDRNESDNLSDDSDEDDEDDDDDDDDDDDESYVDDEGDEDD